MGLSGFTHDKSLEMAPNLVDQRRYFGRLYDNDFGLIKECRDGLYRGWFQTD